MKRREEKEYEDRRDRFVQFELKHPEETRQAVQSVESVVRTDEEHSIYHDWIELCILYELACGFHDAPDVSGYIVHCGIHRGGSLCVMALGTFNSLTTTPVIGIDPYDTRRTHNGIEDFSGVAYRILRENIHVLKLIDFVCPIIFDDVKLFDFFKVPIRIAFIDSLHEYDHTKREIELLLPNLVDNGWFVFDDYLPEPNGIMDAVNEFIDSNTEFEFNLYCYQYPDMKYSSMVFIQVRRS